MYEAVLFDNDGVLVEPVDRAVLRRATRTAFDALGVPDPDPSHLDLLSVGVDPDRLRAVCEEYGLDPGRFWRARDSHSSRAQRAELRAGRTTCYEDFDAVRAVGVPRGIVSSNQQATIEFMHDHFGTRHLFSTAYGRRPTLRSLGRKKPDPHYVRRALADLDVAEALFVGDSESDVRAAHNAGLDSAFVRRPHRESYALGTDPTYELQGLDDLLALDRVPTDRPEAGAVTGAETDTTTGQPPGVDDGA
jgi:HAD superfamily hydrolase (TIGR01549 family)